QASSPQVENCIVSALGETRALYPSNWDALLLSQGCEITAEQFFHQRRLSSVLVDCFQKKSK
uniref:Uncharacterized protein n=1 Tax=Strigops habroptila TaxID=2489341 RepID=A0A672URJ5_STRHB